MFLWHSFDQFLWRRWSISCFNELKSIQIGFNLLITLELMHCAYRFVSEVKVECWKFWRLKKQSSPRYKNFFCFGGVCASLRIIFECIESKIMQYFDLELILEYLFQQIRNYSINLNWNVLSVCDSVIRFNISKVCSKCRILFSSCILFVSRLRYLSG